MALNICETIIWLHRPYYAKALYAENDSRQSSDYVASYLAVIERCAVSLRPAVTDTRQSLPLCLTSTHGFLLLLPDNGTSGYVHFVNSTLIMFQYHTFNSAVCLGTLVLRDPSNVLADFAYAQIRMATSLYTTLVQGSGPQPRAVRNLQWLVKLQARVSSKMLVAQTHMAEGSSDVNARCEAAEIGEGEDVELLGWRTRLVERASQNKQQARTIESPTSPLAETVPSITDTAQFVSALLQTSGTPIPWSDVQFDGTTNDLVSHHMEHGSGLG